LLNWTVQVDLTTGTPDQVYLIVCLSGRPDRRTFSAVPDSVCAHEVSGISDQVCLPGLPNSEWLAF
jgi:hypothetical protein